MAELDAFREELRAWLEKHAPESVRGVVPTSEGDGNWGGKRATFSPPEMKDWLRAAASRGLTAPTWPSEYGGGGLSKDEAKVLREEMARLKVAPPLIGFGLEMIGPTLLRYGTEEQKRQHLPGIIRGEIRWCQGYSEPGRGFRSGERCAHEGSATTGDHFVINGHEESGPPYGDQYADWMFCAGAHRSRTCREARRASAFVLFSMDQRRVSRVMADSA